MAHAMVPIIPVNANAHCGSMSRSKSSFSSP